MTLELASTRAVEKPWGRTDLRPWSEAGGANCKIGEIWYERRDPGAPEASLLLKLLFTLEPLSVQVHPGDAFARSIGEARGKSETWYVLSAEPGEAVFLEDEETTLQAGALGMQALIAYEARRPDMMMLRPRSGSESYLVGVGSPPVAALSAASQLPDRLALAARP